MIENPNELKARAQREKAMKTIRENVAKKIPLSRRQFICGSLATTALMAFGLTGCTTAEGNTAAESAGTTTIAYTPGTFESIAEGRNGEVKVQVTFSDTKMDEITCEHEESRNIGDAAIEQLTEKYLVGQSLNFDTVSGATLSSLAFSTAVADCVSQAGGDVRALEKAESNFAPAEAIDETCDVCVVGSGGAAFAAAVTAAEAGKTVIMLEKMDIYGGNTNAGEGTFNAPDPKRQDPMGIEDSPDLFYQHTFEGGDSLGDPALVRLLADNALDGIYWMEEHGLKFEDEVFTAIGGLWQRGHAVEVEKNGEQGGSYYISRLKESADATGKVTLYTDAKVESLIQDGSVVVGVSGTRPSSGNTVQVRASSVVLATGGYARNAELAMEYDKRVTKTMPSSNVSSSTGDGLLLGEEVGAGLRNMDLVQIHPLGDPQNGGVATFVGNWLGVEDYLMVNDEGNRFIREDERRDTIAEAILEQPNQEMWLLVDSSDIAQDRAEQIADLVAKGHSFEAQTVEDIGKQINVPSDALLQTVEGYNECVKAGIDTQITPGKELLGTEFSDPAYYASKRIPTIHYTMGGLCINADAQVCTEAGEVIPGLYAAGEVTGGVQGGNRLGGNSFTDLIVFGRIAGTSAAATA